MTVRGRCHCIVIAGLSVIRSCRFCVAEWEVAYVKGMGERRETG
ncbi:hypothetical protein SAMN04487934_10439 [Eubacterium ruminantium]|nr:hypothetical protein SAMN04487934_10439 [Eubacterium ruminantium]